MINNYKVRATYQASDKGWYLDIVPPLYLNGNLVVQDGTHYFKQVFLSKEHCYEFAKRYLVSKGINQEIINNKTDYE